MSAPLVSIVIPAFNAEAYIGDTINSVLDQGNGLVEVIVVDDCSTDATQEVLKKFEGKIHLLTLTQNSGPAAARNAGILRAHGTFIGFLDADDLWAPDALHHLLPALTNGDSDYVRGLTVFFRDTPEGREYLEKPVAEIPIGTSL